MMPIIQWLVVLVAAGGIVMSYVLSLRLTRVRHLQESILAPGKFGRAQEREIRNAVQASELPQDPTLRDAAIQWAREEALYGPRARPFLLLLPFGVALALTGFYLIPGAIAAIVVASVQALTVLLGLSGAQWAHQAQMSSQVLLSRYLGGANDHRADESPTA